jgi:pyrroloquinoline quinone (PQQ) biosynthesis protein C
MLDMSVTEPAPADSLVVPLLHWNAAVFVEDDAVTIELEDSQFLVNGLPPPRVVRLLSLFDGAHALQAAAHLAGIPLQSAVTLADQLIEQGAAISLRDPGADLPPLAFAATCRRLYRNLRERLGYHPLWTGLNYGELSKSVFLGWLLENYHFIDGVNDRLALATATCHDVKIRPMFVKHYTEEWDHYSYFVTALGRMGMSEVEVLATRPLAGTRAVLEHMRRAATRDPLEYAACSGFLESTGEDRSAAALLFERLTRNYASDRPDAIQPLADHMQLDGFYQHNDVVENICSKIDHLPIERASAALQSAVMLVETMEMWSSDIIRAYSGRVTAPRAGFGPIRPRPQPATTPGA